ncbi:hypothetical protein D3C75_547090 [compost metagenome]
MFTGEEIHEVVEAHHGKIKFQIQPIADQILTGFKRSQGHGIERNQYQKAEHREERKKSDSDNSLLLHLIPPS